MNQRHKFLISLRLSSEILQIHSGLLLFLISLDMEIATAFIEFFLMDTFTIELSQRLRSLNSFLLSRRQIYREQLRDLRIHYNTSLTLS
jgi:hypothetical protein